MLTDVEIAYKIKPITASMRDDDYQALCEKAIAIQNGDENIVTDRCQIGNNVVDYYTYVERLCTRSKYNIHFYEFVEKIEEFKEKKFIRNMLTYYENVKNKNKTKNEYVVLKEVFNICIGSINIFRPLMAMEIYAKYKPQCVLDICAGWGGRAVGAAVLNVPHYIGIEINTKLELPYNKLIDFLSQKSTTNVDMHFVSALDINYSQLPPYDMVFTSPPYYFLEKYSHNKQYVNKRTMEEEFYTPLFRNSFEYLQPNGYFILNVNTEIYERVCIPLFGESIEILPFKKSKRQNNYNECIYIWSKQL